MHDTSYRLVNAESDGLLGLIVDRYNEFWVCQFLTTGAELWKEVIVTQLVKLVLCRGIYERSDVDVHTKEGRPKKPGSFLAKNRHFSISRGHGTLGLFSRRHRFPSDAHALKLACLNLELKGLAQRNIENMAVDVFKALRQFRDSQRRFDLIVLDPPKFAKSRSHLGRACRGYKDINMLAFQLLRPGGLLFTFSCSALMTTDLFQKVVADAALDAERDAQIIRRFPQAADHPIALNFPESHYLKGLLVKLW